MKTVEELFKEYSPAQPKSKADKSMQLYDWWDMLAFAQYCREQTNIIKQPK